MNYDDEQPALPHDVFEYEIDVADLDRLKPHDAFRYGIEYGAVVTLIQTGADFEFLFAPENYDRIKKLLDKSNVEWEIETRDDYSTLRVTQIDSGKYFGNIDEG